MDLSKHPGVAALHRSLNAQFPYFSGVLQKQYEVFGGKWLDLFEQELVAFGLNGGERLERAVHGYGKFSLDSMKLQVKFQKTKQYENKTYEQAASEVYQNKEYMFGLYLPGILFSHYLWRHHFQQHVFFENKFLPLIQSAKVFYDIGVGTGFYSKELLMNTKMRGCGFDLSSHSLEHTMMLLKARGVADRYQPSLRNIVTQPVEEQADVLMNIEVLEHLEDPQEFLNALSKMLKVGGHGMISAAINAPNADHIYLYRNAAEVEAQVKKAGFKVIDSTVDNAYEPRAAGDLVPVNAAFIVTK